MTDSCDPTPSGSVSPPAGPLPSAMHPPPCVPSAAEVELAIGAMDWEDSAAAAASGPLSAAVSPGRLLSLRKARVQSVEHPWKGDGRARWLCAAAHCPGAAGADARACAHEDARGVWSVHAAAAAGVIAGSGFDAAGTGGGCDVVGVGAGAGGAAAASFARLSVALAAPFAAAAASF